MSPKTYKKRQKLKELPQNSYNNLKSPNCMGKLDYLRKLEFEEVIQQKNKLSSQIQSIPILLVAISSSILFSLTYLSLLKTSIIHYSLIISLFLLTLILLTIIFYGHNKVFTKFYNGKFSFYPNFLDYNLTNINGL